MSDKPPQKQSVPISLKALPFKMPSKNKLKSRISNFHITLNTNARIDAPLDEIGELVTNLQAAANECFGEETHLTSFVSFPKGGMWDPAHIIGLDVVTGVEIGKDDAHGRRLHLHVQFKVRHRSFIKLDIPAVQEEINAILDRIEFPYRIHYTHVTVHKPELSDYIGKE